MSRAFIAGISGLALTAEERAFLRDIAADPRYSFVQGDICERSDVHDALREHNIDTIINFAAECLIAEPQPSVKRAVDHSIPHAGAPDTHTIGRRNLGQPLNQGGNLFADFAPPRPLFPTAFRQASEEPLGHPGKRCILIGAGADELGEQWMQTESAVQLPGEPLQQ